jgi:Fe-S-cluster containining protein
MELHMTANLLSFNCIIEQKRCTKCCEAIHLPKENAINILKRNASDDDDMILKYWRRISKRVAKKINPYMFSTTWSKDQRNFVNQRAGFFKCLALKDGLCTIYENRPFACRDFAGHGMYAFECANEAYEKRQIEEAKGNKEKCDVS